MEWNQNSQKEQRVVQSNMEGVLQGVLHQIFLHDNEFQISLTE